LERLTRRGGERSGEQQLSAIGRARRPRLLLRRHKDLNQNGGLTVLIVEQNANHALKLAHCGYVMVNGLITMAGTGCELLQRPEIDAAHLEGGGRGRRGGIFGSH
jgi:branched-chain amino acid transport system ATP-binding protein